MRILLYQPNHVGHHYAYLAQMLGGLIDLPVELVLATTEQGVASNEFEISLAPLRKHLRIETCCTRPPKSVYRNAAHRLHELVAAVRAIEPDHVYVLYADAIWQLLAVRSALGYWPFRADLPIEAWLYRGGFTYPRANRPANRIKRRLLRHLIRRGRFAALHLDDELLDDFARRCAGKAGRTRLILTPNPIELRPPVEMAQARSRLGLEPRRRIVCSTGMVARWKGMDLLLKAFVQMLDRGGSETEQLVLAGPHSDDMLAMLSNEPYRTMVKTGRIVSINRYLSTEQMFDFAAASDLTVASYPRHSGRSSIILWAAAAGRPSLGTAWGCIGHVIRTHRLGLTCNVLDGDEFADRLREALQMPWTEQDAQRVRRYAEFHRVENYQRVATTLLRERISAAGKDQ